MLNRMQNLSTQFELHDTMSEAHTNKKENLTTANHRIKMLLFKLKKYSEYTEQCFSFTFTKKNKNNQFLHMHGPDFFPHPLSVSF